MFSFCVLLFSVFRESIRKCLQKLSFTVSYSSTRTRGTPPFLIPILNRLSLQQIYFSNYFLNNYLRGPTKEKTHKQTSDKVEKNQSLFISIAHYFLIPLRNIFVPPLSIMPFSLTTPTTTLHSPLRALFLILG